MIAYINENYRYEIGIAQIAEKLDVTPVRMIKAKEVLTDPNLQIQQVAEEVGYYSTRHFTKLFTQFVGCYPSEYRKGLRRS